MCSIKPHRDAAFLSCGLPKSKSRNGTAQGLSSSFKMDRFFRWPLFARVSLLFRGWTSIFRHDRAYLSPVSSSLAILSYIPTFVLGQLHFSDNLPLYTTTLNILYFFCKFIKVSLDYRRWHFCPPHPERWAKMPSLTELIRGFFPPPMKWFCDYPLEWSAKCQFTTSSEL